MAEGFALRYGADVMEVASAGLVPAAMVAPLTRKAMLVTKGINLEEHWPKSVFDVSGPFDLIVNMSGYPLPKGVTGKEVRSWTVQDPVAGDESVHVEVANLIETMVQQLILEIRNR
jgi:protein-tyrosine-phosphatase